MRLFLVMAILFCGSPVAIAVDDDQKLLQLLETPRLSRLKTIHLESEYSAEVDNKDRKQIARQLIEQYQERLSELNLATAGNVFAKINRILNDFPDLNSLNLRLLVEQAKFQINEQRFFEWWHQACPAAQIATIQNEFLKIGDRVRSIINAAKEERSSIVVALPISDADEPIYRNRIAKLDDMIVRCQYLRGWLSYFLSVFTPTRKPRFLKESKSAFYQALQLDPSLEFKQIDPKWFDTKTKRSRLALVGLGLNFVAENKGIESRKCFDLASPHTIEQANLYRLQGLFFHRNWLGGLKLLRSAPQLDRRAYLLAASSGKVASRSDLIVDQETGRAISELAIEKLLLDFDTSAIKEISRVGSTASLSTWLSAWQNASLAADSDDPKIHAEGLKNIQTAIQSCDQDNTQQRHSMMHYTQGLLHFKLGEIYESIASLDQILYDSISKETTLQKILLLRCQCFIRLAATDIRKTGFALSELRDFTERFPHSKHAPRMNFEYLRIQNRISSPQVALLRLEKYQPDNAMFEFAQVERLRHQQRLWQSDSDAGKDFDPTEYLKMKTLADQIIQNPNQPSTSKLVAALILTRSSLKHTIAPLKIIEQLNTVEPCLRDPNVPESHISLWRYYRFLANQSLNRDSDAYIDAKWLVDSENRQHQLAALTYLTERELNGVNDSQILAWHQQLSTLLGQSPEQLNNSHNARVAANRLVKLYLASGQIESAKLLNDNLLLADDRQSIYWTQAATIYQRLNQPELAIPCWRKIAKSSEIGSDTWFIAKLAIIEIQAKLEPSAALAIYENSVALLGEIEEPWRSRFEQWKVKLQNRPPVNSSR